MRLLVVDHEVSMENKWIEAIQPHWPGVIERLQSNQQALERLSSPYFFPLMVCRADRDTILHARSRGVQRFVIAPCETVQVIEEINTNILGLTNPQGREAQVQLQVMHNTLNSLCHGPVTHRQLQWLRQRCTGVHFQLACAAIDQILRYMDEPNHKAVEIKNALLELSLQVQFRVDRVLQAQYV